MPERGADPEERPGAPRCCVMKDGRPNAAAPRRPSARQRAARALAGAAFLALAALLVRGGLWPAPAADGGIAVAVRAVPRLLALAAGWFGLSHLVAAITAYPGCPELGAIPSLFTRRPVRTTCAPWERLDSIVAGHRRRDS